MSEHIEILRQNKSKIINLLKTASKFEELDDKEFILTLFSSIEKAFDFLKNCKYFELGLS